MTGQTLGQYKILEELGKGRLGVTYLAEDLRLARLVALKVFSSRVYEDAAWWDRIRTATGAAIGLSHPCIASVYSIEEAERSSEKEGRRTVPFVTMEYVPGESMEKANGTDDIPLATVLARGVALADALHHAHQRGSVHGALSPDFIKLQEPDLLKIIDFGMVRIPRPIADPLVSGPHSATLATQTALHPEGMAYLAPEQWDQDKPDPRNDIYSLGMILYRLLSDRSTVGQTTSIPQIHIDRQDVPPELRRIIRKCLSVSLDHRYQSVLEVRTDLEALLAQPQPEEPKEDEKGSHSFRSIHLVGAAILGIILCMGGYFLGRWTFETSQSPITFSIPVTQRSGTPLTVAVSPDGKEIIYTDQGRIATRSLDNGSIRVIRDAGNTRQPFWMEEGTATGYIEGDNPPKLIRHRLADGDRFEMTDLPLAPVYGAVSRPDGTVILALADSENVYGLYALGRQGGPLTPLRLPDPANQEAEIAYPGITTDGDLFYNILKDDEKTVELVADRNGSRQVLQSNQTRTWYIGAHASGNRLVYQEGASIWWTPFDAADLKVTGERKLIHQNASHPALAGNTLVFISTPPPSEQLVWVRRSGEVVRNMEMEADRIRDVSISRTGSRLVASCTHSGNTNICYHDERSASQTLTFQPGEERYPVWSPDGQQILYAGQSASGPDLHLQRADGSREAIPLTSDIYEEAWPDWSSDKKHIVYQRKRDGQNDLWYTTMSSKAAEPFLVTNDDERTPVFSPDGRYIAYASDKSGRYEIYVRSFPDNGQEYMISDKGGLFPQWVGDELFFVEDNRLMVVRFDPDGDETAHIVLHGAQYDTVLADNDTRRYVVTSTDGMIAIVVPAPQGADVEMVVVHNWEERFK